MSSLTKRIWKTKKGATIKWVFSYYKDGVRHRKNFNKKPSVEELAELTKTKLQNPYFKNAVEDYIQECSLHCKESTIETYLNYKKVALSPLHKKKIKDITKNEMSKFFVNLKEEKAPKTFNNILMFLKGFFNYLVECKLISESPIKKIKTLPLGKKQAKALEDDERESFIRNSEKSLPFWAHLFLMTMYYTGARISECIALEWTDIDFLRHKIRINKQFYRGRITETKNYETREIDIPNPLLLMLREHEKTSFLLFPSPIEKDKYISVNNIRERHFKRVVELMEDELERNLSNLTPHCLRHTHATYLLSNGIPVKYVSERLGHKDTKTTINIYNHALQSDNEKAIEMLNNMDGRKMGAKNIKVG